MPQSRHVFLILAVWLGGSSVHAQVPTHPSPSAAHPAIQSAEVRAEQLVEQEWRLALAPGISAAVAYEGKLVFSVAYGTADLDNAVPATTEAVYNIGSVSKAITAIAVMQLVEQGRVGLDDPIQNYVPEFPYKLAPVTIRHLLTHTSGIRHYRPSDFPLSLDNENWRPYPTLADAIAIFRNDSLLFRPGSFRFYSSYAVNLLQGVVEHATGLGFEEYLRRNVWNPAGMLATQFDVPTRIVPHRARSYAMGFDGTIRNAYYGDLSYKYASGGMISTVGDLVRLGMSLNHGTLLKPETRTQMLTDQTGDLLVFRIGAPPERTDWQQGLLWQVRSDEAGRRFAYHCGSVKEFSACIVDYVDADLVAAVAANGDAGGYRFTSALANLFRPSPR